MVDGAFVIKDPRLRDVFEDSCLRCCVAKVSDTVVSDDVICN